MLPVIVDNSNSSIAFTFSFSKSLQKCLSTVVQWKKIKPHTDSKLCLSVHNFHWKTRYVQCNGKDTLKFPLPCHLLPCVKGWLWSNYSFGDADAVLVLDSLFQYPILLPDLWDLSVQGELRTFSKVLAWWLKKSVCPYESEKEHKWKNRI